MPKGRSEPLQDRNTAPVVARVRQRQEDAGDQDLELFPAPEDLYGVLVYVREREALLERELKRLVDNDADRPLIDAARTALREQCLDRLVLNRRARQLLDIEEDMILDAARRAGVKGKEQAEAMGMDSRGGPALRHQRLKAARASGWQLRTPRLVQAAAEAKATEERRVAEGHPRVQAAAEDLLSFRVVFPTDEDLDDWWDDLAAFFEEGREELSPSQRASALIHLRTVVNDTKALLARHPRVSGEAMAALTAAEEVARRN
ncbi:hypothetical protein [Streptomyces niveus]|uniref:hypothetical protein n=1 Tax=Streptomyces niveus TaxID=193462 RepID=UPI0034258BA1